MGQAMIAALLSAAAANPTQILNIIQQILDILKANPALVQELVSGYQNRAK